MASAAFGTQDRGSLFLPQQTDKLINVHDWSLAVICLQVNRQQASAQLAVYME